MVNSVGAGPIWPARRNPYILPYMSLEGHVPSKDEKIFKRVFYFIMSGRNWTVKEIEKRKEKKKMEKNGCGSYSYSVHSTWVASKPPQPQGKAFHKPGGMEARVAG